MLQRFSLDTSVKILGALHIIFHSIHLGKGWTCCSLNTPTVCNSLHVPTHSVSSLISKQCIFVIVFWLGGVFFFFSPLCFCFLRRITVYLIFYGRSHHTQHMVSHSAFYKFSLGSLYLWVEIGILIVSFWLQE